MLRTTAHVLAGSRPGRPGSRPCAGRRFTGESGRHSALLVASQVLPPWLTALADLLTRTPCSYRTPPGRHDGSYLARGFCQATSRARAALGGAQQPRASDVELQVGDDLPAHLARRLAAARPLVAGSLAAANDPPSRCATKVRSAAASSMTRASSTMRAGCRRIPTAAWGDRDWGGSELQGLGAGRGSWHNLSQIGPRSPPGLHTAKNAYTTGVQPRY